MAAFDVGSNAIRLALAQVRGQNFQILNRFRTPLRLGTEAFAQKEFTEATMQKVVQFFVEKREFLDAQKVGDIRAVATSAWRNVRNGEVLRQRVWQKSGIEIEAISGDEEARLIRRAIQNVMPNLASGNFLLCDIGGGSVELSILKRGQLVAEQSFPLGTIRLLELAKDCLEGELSQVKEFLGKSILDSWEMVGTGGNFKRFIKIRDKQGGVKSDFLSSLEAGELITSLENITQTQMAQQFELEPGQADLILPALHLLVALLTLTKIQKIHAPDVGLVHGVLDSML